MPCRRPLIAGRTLINTNELLGSYPDADGIKTGTTDAAGECLIASVSRDGHRLLVVVLGSQDRYADARALLDYAAAGWRWGVALRCRMTHWPGRRAPEARLYRLRSAETFDIFLPVWQWPLVQPVRRIDASVPLTGTLPVGSLTWLLGNEVIASVPLTAVRARKGCSLHWGPVFGIEPLGGLCGGAERPAEASNPVIGQRCLGNEALPIVRVG